MKGYNPCLGTGCLCEALKRAQTEQELAEELAKTVSLRSLKGEKPVLGSVHLWLFILNHYWNSKKPL